jgi:hypothetical protein
MKKSQPIILNSALYRSEGFNDTDKAIVTEIPVEAVSNDYLERAFNQTKPCSGRWIRNLSGQTSGTKK